MKTLNIDKETHERLLSHKTSKGEPINSVIVRLLDTWEDFYGKT